MMQRFASIATVFMAMLLSGNVHCQDCRTLVKTANVFYTHGHYREAVQVVEPVLRSLDTSILLQDTSCRKLYLFSGTCLFANGQFREAISIFEKIRNDILIRGGSCDPEYARVLKCLADCYLQLGDYETAYPFYRQCEGILRMQGGIDTPDYAELADNLAMLYCYQGKFDSSLNLLMESRDVRNRISGVHTAGYATTLDNFANLYYEMGRFPEALSSEEEALGIRAELLGLRHPDYARSLTNLAAIYQSVGKYDTALVLFQEAMGIYKETLGEKHPDYAVVLLNMANLHRRLGKYPEALPLFREAAGIDLETSGKMSPNYAISLFNLAGVYSLMGNYDSALATYLQVRYIMERTLGTQHPDYARVLSNLGYVYIRTGDYEKAVPLYIQVVALYKVVLGPRHVEYARALNNLAILYKRLGKYENALPLFKESIQIREEILGKDHPDYAKSLNMLASLYEDMGNYRQATQLYEEASAINRKALGSRHPDYAYDLLNLARHLQGTGQDSLCLRMVEEALSIIMETKGNQNDDYASILNELGRYYDKLGRYDSALIAYTRSLEITRDVLGTNHPNYANTLQNLAHYYWQQGNCDVAIPRLTESSGIYKKILGNSSPEYAQSLTELTEINLDCNDKASALPYLEEADTLISQNLMENFTFLSEEDKKLYLAKIGYFYDLYLSALLTSFRDSPELLALGYTNELLVKGLILNTEAATQKAILASGDTVIIQMYETLRQLRRQMYSWQQKPVRERSVNLEELKDQVEKMSDEVAFRSKEFKTMQLSLRTNWKEVHSHLEAGEAAIEFVCFRPRIRGRTEGDRCYCAYILSNDDPAPRMVYLCTESQLKQVLPPLNASPSLINRTYAGNSLYQLIWAPLDSLLPGIRKVYYSPAGLLHNVSFAAIMSPKGNVLLNEFRLCQVSSTRVVAHQQKVKPVTSAVVIGGISYDVDTAAFFRYGSGTGGSAFHPHSNSPIQNRGSAGGYRYLPGTLKEVTLIRDKMLKKGIKARVYTADAALEESFIGLSGKDAPALIHIATHAYYFPDTINDKIRALRLASGSGDAIFRYSDDPMFRSGLLMTGANLTLKSIPLPPGVEDGILTAREVSNLNLMKTQLVVLSACRTGQGDIMGSEGVEGLQRGFKMAGVRFLVMSLWEVPDKETTEFMDLFYDQLLGAQDIREAFRNTQVSMMKRYLHDPNKWAAFVLVE